MENTHSSIGYIFYVIVRRGRIIQVLKRFKIRTLYIYAVERMMAVYKKIVLGRQWNTYTCHNLKWNDTRVFSKFY